MCFSNITIIIILFAFSFSAKKRFTEIPRQPEVLRPREIVYLSPNSEGYHLIHIL